MNLRLNEIENTIGITLDETTSPRDVQQLLEISRPPAESISHLSRCRTTGRHSRGRLCHKRLHRTPNDRPHERYLTHPVFNTHHTETEMLRVHPHARIARSVADAFDDPARLVHDEAERDQRDAAGDLARVWPAASVRAGRSDSRISSVVRAIWRSGSRRSRASPAVSLQPNAGSQGEYAGLLAIRGYHESRGQGASEHLPDSRLGARHQSLQRGGRRDAKLLRSSATRAAISTWRT